MSELREWLTWETLYKLVHDYRELGIIPGLLLPFVEAFLPFLPLVVLVTANATAFGLWLGFLISWIGASVGAICVFSIVRKYGKIRALTFLQRHKTVQSFMYWIDEHGFAPLFIILCFPFTPSALVNVVAGLSGISQKQYLLAVLSGKMVMIFTISFIGYDVLSLIKQPLKLAMLGVIILILWFVGKKVETRFKREANQESVRDN